MKKLSWLPVLWVCMLLLPVGAMAQDELDVNVNTRSTFQQWMVALPTPQVEGFTGDRAASLQSTVLDVLEYDLEVAERFQFVPNRQLLDAAQAEDEKNDRINYLQWNRFATQLLVKSEIESHPKGAVVRFHLHDTDVGTLIKSLEYGPTDLDNLRRVAHKFADFVVGRYVGESVASTRIAFIRKVSGIKELYTIDYDGHEDSLKQITRDNSIALFPSWSPDGKVITYSSFKHGDADLFSFNRYTGLTRTVSNYGGIDTCARWHPSGSHIVLSLSRDWNTELYSMNPDGSNPQRLTRRPDTIETSACYTPDGNSIVCTTDPGGLNRLAIMPARGGELTTIYSTSSLSCETPDVHPDGNRIVFALRRGDESYICLVNIDGSGVARLTDRNLVAENPTWSPNGKFIIFSGSRRGGPTQLFRLRVRGPGEYAPEGVVDEPVQVTYLTGECLSPAWSPQLPD